MKAALRTVLSLSAVAALLGAAGCGSSPGSPVAASPAGSGATIQGTVNTGAGVSSASVSALSAGSGIQISVVGTSLVTTTDPSGRFVLKGIPPGTATLRFQGPGVDALLQVSGLAPGQTLTITVKVSGSQAVLVSPPSTSPGTEKVEFTGTIESITPPRLRVSGRTVETNAETEIKRGDTRISVTALKVGETVKVEGSLLPDQSVLARGLEVKSPDEDDDEVEFTGTIESITPPSLRVSGRTVVTNADTEFEGEGRTGSLADFKVGDRVEVEGTLLSDGSVLARELKKLEGDDDEKEVEFKGRIESITPPSLRVSGRTVQTDSATKIERDDKTITLTDLKVGETAEVKGTLLADGSVLARKIEVEEDDD